MPKYSLIEHKLRRYVYLGHECAIYVPPPIRNNYWKNLAHQENITGVRIIGKIIKKNKIEDINSIVSILLKIKKEDNLYDDRNLIFALAVCAKLNLEQCVQMVADAYSAVSLICTDGLKLLMFVKFITVAISILHDQGYLPNATKGFDNKLCKTLQSWYLSKNPLFTAEQIVGHKSYDGWSHKDVMKLIHIHSDEPSRQVYIIYTIFGMEKVEELFKPKLIEVTNEKPDGEFLTYEELKFKNVYTYLERVSNLNKMDENTLVKNIELNKWGKEFEVVPQKMLKSSKVLTALIMHMPMETLLDKTFQFSKQRLFVNSSPDEGLWAYILRFSNEFLFSKLRIHPIEVFLQYVRYSRTRLNIMKLQNKIVKKHFTKVELPTRQNENNIHQQISINCRHKKYLTKKMSKNTKSKFIKNQTQRKTIETDINSSESNLVLIKPPVKLSGPLMNFLSKKLVNKFLKNLKPSGCRMLIAYDGRQFTEKNHCEYSHLLVIHEAFVLIILSLIYPEKSQNNKPTIIALDRSKTKPHEIKINYKKNLTFHSLQIALIKSEVEAESNENGTLIPTPDFIMRWAEERKKEYDIFVFLGTNEMNLSLIKAAKKNYQYFLKKPVKIIVCCLNGKHKEQSNLSGQNILFVYGFDKNVGKVISSFINGEF